MAGQRFVRLGCCVTDFCRKTGGHFCEICLAEMQRDRPQHAGGNGQIRIRRHDPDRERPQHRLDVGARRAELGVVADDLRPVHGPQGGAIDDGLDAIRARFVEQQGQEGPRRPERRRSFGPGVTGTACEKVVDRRTGPALDQAAAHGLCPGDGLIQSAQDDRIAGILDQDFPLREAVPLAQGSGQTEVPIGQDHSLHDDHRIPIDSVAPMPV
ncbi:hypothetical protein [Methylobacterium sp. MA0201]|uniref:hypothetical protein n=1 Tax=Methylobacterium alsaeris TaxID=3344826 RepID=UPI0037565557